MQSLADFFEMETNKKVNISRYNNQQLKPNQNLITFNGETYVFELIDKVVLDNISGNCYLIYQFNLDVNNLKGMLNNLYENIDILEYGKYLIISSKHELNIDSTTPEIIESETYSKTYIAYLGNITDTSILKFRLSIVNEIISNISTKNSFSNFITLHDLTMYKVISLIKDDKSIYNLIDLKIIKNMDNNLLSTGLSFIENDLNISKTSSALFLHRNTLIYRLEKIKEILGLDLKVFKDAFIFYLSIKSYLLYK